MPDETAPHKPSVGSDHNIVPLLKSDLFVSAVAAIMNENAPDGYRFIVCDETRILGSGCGGFSRMSIDEPERQATLGDRINIASMSKTITAAAVLSTLQSKNLSPDIPVAPFMPPQWALSDIVKTLTFRDFLTHRTGFWEDGAEDVHQDFNDYENIGRMMGQSPWNPTKTRWDYRNINFAVFRNVLPYLDSYDRHSSKVALEIPRGRDAAQFLANAYIEIVNRRVLQPSGVAAAGCNSKTLVPPPGKNGRPAPLSAYLPVLSYPYQNRSHKGIDIGDRTLYCGADGWCLSVAEIAKVLQTVLFTEILISTGIRDLMLAGGPGNHNGLGINMDDDVGGSHVYMHGAWIPFTNPPKPEDPALAGWFFYFEKPRWIVVALSNVGHNPNLDNWGTRVRKAFADVWTEPRNINEAHSSLPLNP